MDADMVAMFPNGIRALIVDDDTKFLKSATATLSTLNFEVVTCSTVAYALKSLTTGKLKGFDVVLAHAAKAAACGFDFRTIVETDLLIPVIYFLPPDHQAAGEEAEELLRTLEAAGSYVVQKPLDADEVRTRLWTVIAWRKCGLETKASGGKQRGAGVDLEGEDEGRVHYKVVRARRPRKRKGGAGSSEHAAGGTTVAAAGGGDHPASGKEKDNEANNQQEPAHQQKHGRGKKAQKNSGEAFKQVQQPDEGMVSGKQPRQWHPRLSSLFVESVLRTLNMPPYSPKFFSHFAGPSSFAAAPPAAPPPVYSAAIAPPAPAPPRPVYASAPPALPPAVRQQQQPAVNNVVLGGMAPPAAATAMPAAATASYETQVSRGGTQTQQLQVGRRQLISGPFPHQAPLPPLPPVVQQVMVAAPPAAAGDGGPSTGGMAAGASAPAATEAGPGAPQHDGDASGKVATLAEVLGNDYSGGSSLAAPDGQVVAMVPADLNGLITGGELGSTGAASSAAGRGGGGSGSSAALFMASNVSGLAMAGGGGASGSSSSSAAPFVAPDGGSSKAPPLMAPDQDLSDASADQCEDNTSFPLDALLGDLHGPMSEFDDAQAQLGGSTGGAAAHDAAGTTRNGGEEEGGLVEALLASDHQHEDGIIDALLGDLHGPIFEFDDVHLDAQLGGSSTGGSGEDAIDDLNGIDIPFDVWTFEMEDFMAPRHKNNVRE